MASDLKNPSISLHNGHNGAKSIENPQPKKFLLVDWESLNGDLAWQVQKEGHEVKMYIKEQTDVDVYDGILTKVSDWENEVGWADVIVFDDTLGFGKIAEKLRKLMPEAGLSALPTFQQLLTSLPRSLYPELC